MRWGVHRRWKASGAPGWSQAASTRTPRAVPLEPAFIDLLPPLELTATPHSLAAIFATVLQRDHTPPTVSIDHLHLPQVSVPEQRSLILARLRPGERLEFADLVADAEDTLVVVARFLAVLELYKAHAIDAQQVEALGQLDISWTGKDVDPAVVAAANWE